ncbi:unnamed protein product [Mytilus edulis]|uniref:PHD-type domain-containing protein n=1 Tax=Mytilus edulis TaxID=6550 RepID=A0A8S3PX29_MYTED|nr:unnamed protein product [Mytilus edulis]
MDMISTLSKSKSTGSLKGLHQLSNSKDSNLDNISTRSKNYSLNRSKALDKKQETCQKQHIQYEMKPGKNFVIEFSTAAFEATKNFLLSHFTSENFNNNLAVKEQKNLDSTHITVDHSYRIYNRKNNGQIGSQLKYVVNVYNTTSLINVNGSRVELFVNGIFKDLCAYLSKHFDSFDILNNEIANYLEDISANYKDKDRNLGNSASSILKGKSRQPTVGTSTTCRLALSPSPSPQVLDISSGSPKSTPLESSISKPLTEICPMCSEFVVEEGIACDKCNFWLHFECTGINKDKTNLNSIQGEDFICMLCNNDLLYEDRNTNETLCQVTQDNEDIHSDSILSNLSIIDPSSNTHKQLISNSPAINSSNDAKGELGHPTVGLSTTSCPDFPLATASDTIGSQNENQVNIPINAEVIKLKTTKRAYKTKDEKEDIIINQKTRILNLENEINQLKNVVNSLSLNSSNHNVHSQNESQHNQSSCCQQKIRDELMEQRIRMLENQMVQNMCINTALTTQLAMQTRSAYPMSAHPPNMHCGAPPFNHFQHPVSTSSHIPLHPIPSFQAYNHHQFIHQFQPPAYNDPNAPHLNNIHMAYPSTNHMDTRGLHDRPQQSQQCNYPQQGQPIGQFPVSHAETQSRQSSAHVKNSQQQSHSQSSQRKPSHLPNNSQVMDSHSQHKRTIHQTNQVQHTAHQKSRKLSTTKQLPLRDRLGKSGQPIVGLSTTCRPALLPTPSTGEGTSLQLLSESIDLYTNTNHDVTVSHSSINITSQDSPVSPSLDAQTNSNVNTKGNSDHPFRQTGLLKHPPDQRVILRSTRL